METPTFKKIQYSSETLHFGMNEVTCLVFGTKRFLLTQGLNACFAVYLVSPTAAVGAHIPPHPGHDARDSQAGDKNLVAKMQELASLYLKNKPHFMVHNVALIYAKIHGKTALPDKKQFIENCLRQFKVDFPIQDYDVKLSGAPRREEHGTAFVDGRSANGSVLYLQDKPILRVFKGQPAISQESPKPTSPQQPISTPVTGMPQYSNPVFPRQASEAETGVPQYSEAALPHYSNPIFPRQTTEAKTDISRNPVSEPRISVGSQTSSAVQAQEQSQQEPTNQLRYVKSTPDKGGRIVETTRGKVLIKAEDWEKASVKGKLVLYCKKYKFYTDL